MKRLATLVFLALGLFLGGCNKDDRVENFVQKLDAVTAEVVKRAEAGSDRKAALASAQQYLDQNSAEVAGAYKEIEGLRGFEVSEEAMKKLTDSVTDNSTKVMTLRIKFAGERVSDPAFGKSLEKLTDDYNKMIGMDA